MPDDLYAAGMEVELELDDLIARIKKACKEQWKSRLKKYELDTSMINKITEIE